MAHQAIERETTHRHTLKSAPSAVACRPQQQLRLTRGARLLTQVAAGATQQTAAHFSGGSKAWPLSPEQILHEIKAMATSPASRGLHAPVVMTGANIIRLPLLGSRPSS